MSSFIDKYKVGKTKYLIYYFRGEIKVKEGYVNTLNDIPYPETVFYPKNENTWQTGIPSCCGVVSSKGKIVVRNKEDIPKAVRMVQEHYIAKIDETQNKAITALTNIQKMIDQMKEGE